MTDNTVDFQVFKSKKDEEDQELSDQQLVEDFFKKVQSDHAEVYKGYLNGLAQTLEEEEGYTFDGGGLFAYFDSEGNIGFRAFGVPPMEAVGLLEYAKNLVLRESYGT